ncbi:MAG TPA: hypothetical protein VNW92_16775, partial [Polyangiaceae bacterium]|nr:hypothetical protein [Polyangiaceae bacterium]
TRLSAGERALYHQVHPLKLATDLASAVLSLVLLAKHRPWLGLLVLFVPSILASALFITFGNFSKTKRSRTGKYLRRYMTAAMQATRLAGMGIAAIGAWLHAFWLVPLGAITIAWAWCGTWLVNRYRRLH